MCAQYRDAMLPRPCRCAFWKLGKYDSESDGIGEY